MNKAQHIKRRCDALTAARQLHTQVWRDCADYTFPVRADGLDNQIITATDAQQRKAIIYDATAPDSCKVGAATIMGAMIPASAQWFGLDIGEASDEEQRWLDDMARFMWQNLHSSNFNAEALDALIDAMWAGWFVLYEDAQPDGGYYFELWPIGQCKIASSRSGSVVDTVYREWEWSVSQVVADYGIDKVSPRTRELHQQGKFDEKVGLLMAIEPRELYVVGSRIGRELPFASCHYELQDMHLLREGGYHEFPCMVPRWSRLPGSAYATGPMSDALPDVRSLNEVARFTLMAAETALAPPMVVEDDGVINVKNFRMGPRKIIVANSVDSIKPLLTGAKVEAGILTAERLQGTVRKILLADQLPPMDGPVRTAYEWSVRVDQMRRMLGPLFARFETEFLQSLIERTFGITWRANEASGFRLLGEPPQSLLGRSFSVRYLSPMARAQRMDDVAAMDRFEQALAVEAQMDPTLLDVYDFEGAARERASLLGVPNKLIRDAKATNQVREARQQAQAKQQAQEVQTAGVVQMQGAMAQRLAKAA
jgi:Bacteriophage head to tail connecting protein